MPLPPKLQTKIINDPVFGFIQINHPLVMRLVEHPFLQRLKRIKQLGLSSGVYPGAQHTRFQHALGAMYLMQEAILTLRSKGNVITANEETGALAAILLHDIGHGPFSHVLEASIVDVHHEKISLLLMQLLNKEFEGQLSLAINIFTGNYHKKFLSQLVSGQLDVDRLDYLRRDSFYTGVTEGTIGSARIIKMLNVVEDQLVVEAKGIYSIEKFLIARRLMYWQVYLHKTSIAAEKMLINLLRRAKELARNKQQIFMTPALKYFIEQEVTLEDLSQNSLALEQFIKLDDHEVMTCIKYWQQEDDIILKTLAEGIINRKLYKIELSNSSIDKENIKIKSEAVLAAYPQVKDHLNYFVFTGSITNELYDPGEDKIKILFKNGETTDISDASEIINISLNNRKSEKYFICSLRI
jgi:uncharacterized protein